MEVKKVIIYCLFLKKNEKSFVSFRKSTTFAVAIRRKSIKNAFDMGPGGGMVDALVSGASGESRAGSSPVLGTIN